MNIKSLCLTTYQLCLVAILLFLAGCDQSKMDDTPWINLFDGNSVLRGQDPLKTDSEGIVEN